MKIDYPDSTDKIISRLLSSGYKAYIVGGCVRDAFLKQTPNDYDIATNALPDKVIQLFSDCTVIPTGLKHGTVTVISDGIPAEITTFRSDCEYINHRHPSNVIFSLSFEDDAARRDFTVNAMAYNHVEGIKDVFGGRSDIKNKIIRTVGDPDERFNEDALRILRALRFASTLGFKIERKTSLSIHRNKELLKSISAERIYSEFVKLISGVGVKDILTEYADVIACFIPEITPMIGFDQHNFHHIYDVWTHTVYAVANIKNTNVLKLAAFFHDIGKPQKFSLSQDGTGHFYGHCAASVETARNVLKRLRADNDTISSVLSIVKYHDMQIPEDKKIIRRHMSKLSPDTFFDLISMFRADTLSLSPQFADRESHFANLESIARQIMQEQSCLSLKSLAIDGNDIIALGIPQGKQIGLILNKLLDAVIADQIPNTKQALLNEVQHYAKSR